MGRGALAGSSPSAGASAAARSRRDCTLRLVGPFALWMVGAALVATALVGAYVLALDRWWELDSDPRVAADFWLGMIMLGPFIFYLSPILGIPLAIVLGKLIGLAAVRAVSVARRAGRAGS